MGFPVFSDSYQYFLASRLISYLVVYRQILINKERCFELYDEKKPPICTLKTRFYLLIFFSIPKTDTLDIYAN
jgi:hypothetical protein